jgi:hypothetical protein
MRQGEYEKAEGRRKLLYASLLRHLILTMMVYSRAKGNRLKRFFKRPKTKIVRTTRSNEILMHGDDRIYSKDLRALLTTVRDRLLLWALKLVICLPDLLSVVYSPPRHVISA